MAQLVAADKVAGTVQQGCQRLERLLGDSDPQPVLEQFARIKVGLKLSELNDPVRTAPRLQRPSVLGRQYIPDFC